MTISPSNRKQAWKQWATAAPSLLILIVLIVYPLLTLLVQIILPHLFDVEISLKPSLDAIREVFTDKSNYAAVFNSFVIGVVAALWATVLGTCTALGAARSPRPLRNLIHILVWTVFFAPSFILAEGWLALMQDRGIIADLFHLPNGWSAWFFTPAGLLFAMGFRYFPFVHMAMEQAIANLDDTYLNAARLSGYTSGQVFRRIALPLLTPALLAGASIAFAEGFGDFGFAAAITPQTHIPLLAYQLYSALNETPVDYAGASGLALILVLVTAGVLVFQMWWMRRKSYVTVTSGSRRGNWNVARVGWMSIVALVILFVGLILPVGATVIESFLKGDATSFAPSAWTIANYTHVFSSKDGNTVLSLLRSFRYSLITAVLTMAIGGMVSYLMAFRESSAARVLNVLTMSTVAIPGVVLAASYIFAWNAVWLIPLHLVFYGTPVCLAMAYVAGHLPYAIRLQYGAMSQLSPSLIRAARVLGAGNTRILMRIVLPLVSATTVSTFFLTLTDTMFELPASSLLYPAGYPPFPVVVQGKFNAFQWGEGSALSVVGMVIVFGLYAVGRFIANRLERRIVRHAMQQSEIEELTSGSLQLTLEV